MPTDPSFAEILNQMKLQTEQLKSINDNINSAAGWNSVLGRAGLDFIVICFADILAAGTVLLTLDAWKERDALHRERANKLLKIVRPHTTAMVSWMENTALKQPGIPIGPPWNSTATSLFADLFSTELAEGSLELLYPDGNELFEALTQVRKLILESKATSNSIWGGETEQNLNLLNAFKKLDAVARAQVEKYSSGSVQSAMARFLSWLRSHISLARQK